MFLDAIHQERYRKLIIKDNTYLTDVERQALFYLIAGNSDVYSKVNFIYDFEDRSIEPDCLTNGEVDFCSSAKKLIKLGFNLYNSYEGDTVVDTFAILDDQQFKLAMNAIHIRFYGLADRRD